MATKKNPGGRPTKYDPKYCEMLIEHMEEGASMTSFAAKIRVSRSTIGKWIDEHDDFAEAAGIGKALCASWWERVARVNAASNMGSSSMTIFGLCNMAAEDWRNKQEVDHTTKGKEIKGFNQLYGVTESKPS